MNSPTYASVGVVDDTCRAARNAMKILSKHLVILSSSYSKKPYQESSGSEILEALRVTRECIETMCDSLSKVTSLDKTVYTDEFPSTFVITDKEYAFYNAILQQYHSEIMFNNNSSTAFSLFSSENDICCQLRQPQPEWQDNEEKSKHS